LTPKSRRPQVSPDYIALPGSEGPPPSGAAIGSVSPEQGLAVTVIVRRKAVLPPADAAPLSAGEAGKVRRPMTRAELAESFGADPADVDKVAAFARELGLRVTGSDAARRSINLAGTAQDFGTAFGVCLQLYQDDGRTYRAFTGPIYLPADLGGVVEAVLGLDDLPAARPR
jgi:kumamolisin